MINSTTQTTNNSPNFKAIIPIKSVHIADKLNRTDVLKTDFQEVIDEKKTRSLVNHIKSVLFKKTAEPTIKKKKLPSGGFGYNTTPAEESDPLTKWLNNRIRNRFNQGSTEQDYLIYNNSKYYDLYDKKFRFFYDKNTGESFILTGNEAKLLDNAGKNHGLIKNAIKQTAKSIGIKTGKKKEELNKFVEDFMESSPVLKTANIKFAKALENLYSRMNPEQTGIHLYGVKKPNSTAIKPVGIRFE